MTEHGDWDPLDPDTVADPHAAYADLRERCPVPYSERWGGFWSLLRYDDVRDVLGDAMSFISSVQNVVPKVAASRKRIPLHVDPPEHAQYRRVLNPPFEEPRVAELEAEIRTYAAELLDPLIARGRGDLARELADPFPVLVLCAFLHTPREDARLLKALGERFVRAHHAGDDATVEETSRELYAYAADLVAERKARPLDPATDVATSLLHARIDGEPIPDEVVVGGLRQLLVAGHLAATLVLASAAAHLAAHPGLQDELRRAPARIPDAMEEFLRLYTPNQGFARTSRREVEIRGRRIGPDTPIAIVLSAADRDPAVFERPDEFDMDRRPNRHLAFGHGVHKCLGAPLARLEIRVALEELLARSPRFVLDGDVPFTRWPEYGAVSVPVRFERG